LQVKVKDIDLVAMMIGSGWHRASLWWLGGWGSAGGLDRRFQSGSDRSIPW